MTNCINCGAVLHGNVCEYCGTVYEAEEYFHSEDNCCDFDSYTDSNGILHRMINHHKHKE